MISRLFKDILGMQQAIRFSRGVTYIARSPELACLLELYFVMDCSIETSTFLITTVAQEGSEEERRSHAHLSDVQRREPSPEQHPPTVLLPLFDVVQAIHK